MNNRFGDVPDKVSRWLTPEEFAALSSIEKDIYIFALFKLVGHEPTPQPRDKRDSSPHN
jgi:hypothetical protein